MKMAAGISGGFRSALFALPPTALALGPKYGETK